MSNYKITIVLIMLLSVQYGVAEAKDFFKGKKANKESEVVQVDKVGLKDDVTKLSSITFRDKSEGFVLDKRAEYVFRRLNEVGCNAKYQEFIVEGNKYYNIICRLGPKEGKVFVVGAHYDVFDDLPGADDNASGVVGLIELARLVKLNEWKLKNPLELVAYSLEEPPYFRTKYMGSYFHAKSLKDSNVEVELMLSLEMIGYFSDEKDSQKYPAFFLKWFYPNKGDFIAVVGKWGQGGYVRKIKKLMVKHGDGLKVEKLTAPPSLVGVDFSDHMNYWGFGYKAVMVTDTAFYRNPNYHEPTDTVDTLNFSRMALVVKGIYGAVIGWD